MNDVNLSIAVCTHNPDPRLLKALLHSIQKLENIDNVLDIVVVDNLSAPPLSENFTLQAFLAKHPNSKCVVEERLGLTAARCRAVKETRGDIVVFFDDDNEPSPNYLDVLNLYFRDFSTVGVWGPGLIKVDYIDGVPNSMSKNIDMLNAVFQDKCSSFGYVCTPNEFSSWCPFGTGFAVRRVVLENYCKLVSDGKIMTTDRCGLSLAGCGDVQIVFEAFKLGLAAGVIPALACRHNILKRKLSVAYLTGVNYGSYLSYRLAFAESFPDAPLPHFTNGSFLKFITSYCISFLFNLFPCSSRLSSLVDRAGLLGDAFGKAALVAPKSLRYKALRFFSRLNGFS